jgi:hypothetical protein
MQVDMKIEEDIINIEEGADKIVAEGKTDAQRISAGLDEQKEKIEAEFESKFSSESASLKKRYEDRLARELAEAAMDSKRDEESAEKRARAVRDTLVRKIVESYRKQ